MRPAASVRMWHAHQPDVIASAPDKTPSSSNLRRLLLQSARSGTNGGCQEGFLRTWRWFRAVRGRWPTEPTNGRRAQPVGGRLRCVLPRTNAEPGAQSAELPRIMAGPCSFHHSHICRRKTPCSHDLPSSLLSQENIDLGDSLLPGWPIAARCRRMRCRR